MANSVTSTVVHDGARNVVYNLTGILDSSDYAITDFTTISALDPVPTMLRLDHMFYAIEDGLSVRFYWHATTDVLIMPVSGRGWFNFVPFGGLTNTKAAGYTGNLRIGTVGWATGDVLAFSFQIEFVKQFS